MTLTMKVPTIHMNGTSKETLLTQLCDAINAIHEAERKLDAAYPNARDYYPQGPDAILVALREYDERSLKLRAIAEELQTIAESL